MRNQVVFAFKALVACIALVFWFSVCCRMLLENRLVLKTLATSEDPADQRQIWKNQIVIEYFQFRIDHELGAIQNYKNSKSPKTFH